MKYIIMLLIVLGLIIVDYVTGIIKAYASNSLCSKKMRVGGLNKLSEILVMLAAMGLEIGITQLGRYYQSTELAGIVGVITAVGVFIYITAMELISILENYAEINPDAMWIAKLIRKLKMFNENDDNKKGE